MIHEENWCITHNKEILLIQERFRLCLTCIQGQIKNSKTVEEWKHIQVMIKSLSEQRFEQLNLLAQIQDELENYQKQIIKQINETLQSIKDHINNILKKEHNQSIDSSISKIQGMHKEEQKNFERLNNTLYRKMQNIQQNNKQHDNQESQLKNLSTSVESSVAEFESRIINKPPIYTNKLKQNFNYQKIRSSIMNEKCRSLAFNQEGTILALGIAKEIILHTFCDGTLVCELQRLNKHNDIVSYLYFTKLTGKLISGGYDNMVFLWKLNFEQKWIVENTFAAHTDWIYTLTLDFNEQTLITGSKDKSVIFWKVSNQTNKKLQTLILNQMVYCLSMNEDSIQIIACGSDNKIQILGKQSNWVIIQTIEQKVEGIRIQFISNHSFVFQPFNREYLEIFTQDVTQIVYRKTKLVQVPCESEKCQVFFPCQFNGSQVNIFKINEKADEASLIQTINFQTPIIFGTETSEGNFFITWDNKSSQLQIRKLE